MWSDKVHTVLCGQTKYIQYYIVWSDKVHTVLYCVVRQSTYIHTQSFIYPTDAQPDCSKNVKIYIKIYMIGAATCFGFPQPSSGSYYMCFAKVISIKPYPANVEYRVSS